MLPLVLKQLPVLYQFGVGISSQDPEGWTCLNLNKVLPLSLASLSVSIVLAFWTVPDGSLAPQSSRILRGTLAGLSMVNMALAGLALWVCCSCIGMGSVGLSCVSGA